jgi:hypothetical protein
VPVRFTKLLSTPPLRLPADGVGVGVGVGVDETTVTTTLFELEPPLLEHVSV